MTPLSKTTEQAWSIKEFLQLKESCTYRPLTVVAEIKEGEIYLIIIPDCSHHD